MSQIEPGDREEILLRGILNGDTTTNIEPGNRKEAYLKAILENGGGGGGGGGGGLPSVTDADNGDFARVVNGAWDKDPGDDIAKTDGYYEDMSVGYAEQLISSQGLTDRSPYHFRTTGGNSDVGARKNQKVIGGTVVWNQQIDNGTFGSTDGWSTNKCTLTVSGNVGTLTMAENTTASSSLTRTGLSSLPANHQYFCSATVTPEKDTYVCFRVRGVNCPNIQALAGERVTLERVITAGSGSEGFLFYPNKGATLYGGDTVAIENVMCIDLTQMFGEKIADKIASMETNPGQGLAWIRTFGFFDKNTYAYNAGAFLNAKPTSVVDVGFNLLNNGTAHLVGGKTVQITGEYSTLAYTNINGDSETLTPDADGKFTAEKDGTLTVTGYDSTTCVHNVWSGIRDGDFAEYTEVVKEIAGKTVTRKYGIVDMGELSWSYEERAAAPARFHAAVTGMKLPTTKEERATGIVTVNYTASQIPLGTNDGDKLICRYTNGKVYVIDSSYSSAASFTTAVRGKYLIYELAETATETADADTEFRGFLKLSGNDSIYYDGDTVDLGDNLWCEDFGTEEFVDSRTVPMPCGHQTFYRANLADKLNHLPSLPDLGDGDYVVSVSGTQMFLIPIPAELPEFPRAGGNYRLKLTVSTSGKLLTWEAES